MRGLVDIPLGKYLAPTSIRIRFQHGQKSKPPVITTNAAIFPVTVHHWNSPSRLFLMLPPWYHSREGALNTSKHAKYY